MRYINLPTDLPKRGSDLELDVTAYIDRQIMTPVSGDVICLIHAIGEEI